MGTGGSAVGLSAASRATVVIPAARSAVAASPRTTRLTSCSRASSPSQVGHHGQRRHSMTRDGRASAGAPVAAAVATATRSAKRASYSASVLRWPGQCSAARSCQTTTSASSPTTPPCRPKGSPGRGAQPASSSIRCRWARRIRSRVWVRDLRAGSAAACRGSVSGRGEVRAPLPASVTRCRTTITGTYPPPGRRTSSSAPPRRAPPGTSAAPRRAPPGSPGRTDGASEGEPGGPGGAVEIDRGRTAPQISGAPAATAAAVAATRSDASAGTARHPAPATRPSCAPIRTRCSAASARRCADDGSGSACGPATADGSWSRWIRRRQCVVAEASSTTPAGPAPGACAGTWSAVAVTVRSVVTATDSSRAAPSPIPARRLSPSPRVGTFAAASRHLCLRESAPSPARVGAPARRLSRHTGGSARTAPGALSHPGQVVARRPTPTHPAQQVRRSLNLCDGTESIFDSARRVGASRRPPAARAGPVAVAVEEQRSGVIGSGAAGRALSWRPGRPGRSPEHPGSARRS